jgi:hypothetical protein
VISTKFPSSQETRAGVVFGGAIGGQKVACLLGWLVLNQIQCAEAKTHLAPGQMLIKIIPVAKTQPAAVAAGDEGCPHCIRWRWCERESNQPASQPASPSSLSFSFCFAAPKIHYYGIGKLHVGRTFE